MRFMPSLIAALSVVAAGCSSQPSAPSAVPSESATPAAAAAPAGSSTAVASLATAGGRPGSSVVVYVTSQGLYYDSIVTHDPLPMHGRFQLLEMGAMGLQTEFGPGDPGYIGGRWWMDTNNNQMQDAGDHFFLCPLLPPGRTTP